MSDNSDSYLDDFVYQQTDDRKSLQQLDGDFAAYFGQFIHLDIHKEPILSTNIFSNDNGEKILITGGEDEIVKFWSYVNGNIQLLKSFDHKETVIYVGLNRSKKLALSADMSGNLVIWNINDLSNPYKTLTTVDLESCHWHPEDDDIVVYSCVDGSIQKISISNEDYQIFFGPSECNIRSAYYASSIAPDMIPKEDNFAPCITFCNKSPNHLVAGYKSGTLLLWDILNGSIINKVSSSNIIGTHYSVTSISLSSNDELCALGCDVFKSIKIYNPYNPTFIYTISDVSFESKASVESAHFVRNDEFLIIATCYHVSEEKSDGGQLIIWDMALHSVRSMECLEYGITQSIVYKDKYCIIGDTGGYISVYDYMQGQRILKMKLFASPIFCLTISHQSYLCSSSEDLALCVLDIDNIFREI